MKKVLSYFLATMLVVGLFACKGGKSDMLAAKWKISDIGDGREIPADQKEMAEKKKAELFKDSYFEFKKDGTFDLNMAGKSEKGTWKLNDEGSKLFMTHAEGKDKPDTMNVSDLSASKVVLSEETAMEKVMITLTK